VKLPRKYQTILFAVVMALVMSAAVSFAMTVMNPGFGPRFVSAWLRGFGLGVAVSTPIGLAVTPLARRIVDLITEDP
jgi:hypothetical protein